jgi:hypothetical protein
MPLSSGTAARSPVTRLRKPLLVRMYAPVLTGVDGSRALLARMNELKSQVQQ